MKNPLLILPMLLMLTLFSCGKDDDIITSIPDEVNTVDELRATMEDIVANTEVPGFAISIVKNNSIIFQEAFGYADIQSKKPYTNETIQQLASVSKTFAGAAVAKAIEQGYFTLETDINDILPVEVNNPKQPNTTIKVKHLVTHTSGLLDNPAVYFAANYYLLPGEDLSTEGASVLNQQFGITQRTGISLEEFLAEYFLEGGDLYSLDNFSEEAPGTTWAYSNLGTGLTGYLIEVASGQSFADYVKTNILQPLGMQHSTYDISEVNQKDMATWYLNKTTPFPLYANHSYIEGSLFTSNTDFGAYLLDMIKGANGESNTLFSQAGYELLFKNQLPSGIVPADFADNHGLFWIKKDNKVQHGGNSFGVSTYLEFDAADQSGYALITNMDAILDYTAYKEVAQRIAEAVKQFTQAN